MDPVAAWLGLPCLQGGHAWRARRRFRLVPGSRSEWIRRDRIGSDEQDRRCARVLDVDRRIRGEGSARGSTWLPAICRRTPRRGRLLRRRGTGRCQGRGSGHRRRTGCARSSRSVASENTHVIGYDGELRAHVAQPWPRARGIRPRSVVATTVVAGCRRRVNTDPEATFES